MQGELGESGAVKGAWQEYHVVNTMLCSIMNTCNLEICRRHTGNCRSPKIPVLVIIESSHLMLSAFIAEITQDCHDYLVGTSLVPSPFKPVSVHNNTREWKTSKKGTKNLRAFYHVSGCEQDVGGGGGGGKWLMFKYACTPKQVSYWSRHVVSIMLTSRVKNFGRAFE